MDSVHRPMYPVCLSLLLGEAITPDIRFEYLWPEPAVEVFYGTGANHVVQRAAIGDIFVHSDSSGVTRGGVAAAMSPSDMPPISRNLLMRSTWLGPVSSAVHSSL